ncbi:acetyl-CoA hydrolase/transferase C-terminal domain-containing protein [Limnobacter parvus]|uniref:Acetyl-CoA hydrolase n=1 Tax=Limnobacter parvus TaxID=2939690 RepID=A0ABT1XLS0_9BURK|nr:acetyl-CoA hydrolase/transferase C-terminal domain-containing protein [Limnobacter parvus]MCR2747212.1 acetyl-CoA hydrolase [Limnobacter parvus]
MSTHSTNKPVVLDNVEQCVDEILQRLGKQIRVGLPLGLGKPPELINALYLRAKADPSIDLTILTALSLEKPVPGSDTEAAFLKPFVERVWGDCPDLLYAVDATNGKLPGNIKVHEFFFKPGSRMGNVDAQQNYVSTNYTTAARDIFHMGCNLAMQAVCKPDEGEATHYSLSCNPDTSIELVRMLRQSGRGHMVVGVVNQRLPYMGHSAEVPCEEFDVVVDHPRYSTTLFSTPKLPVGLADYALGFYTSALIKDGGTLQVGIGALGDAVVHALHLRHTQNANYQSVLKALNWGEASYKLAEQIGGNTPFENGLYGATEMFVDGFLHLMQAGVLKRKVYDHWALQRLINQGGLDPAKPTSAVWENLVELGVREITPDDLAVFKHHGLLQNNVLMDGVWLVLPNGQRVLANLADPNTLYALAQNSLGSPLKGGTVLHAGFFLGPTAMYSALKNMPQDERDAIHMLGVEHVNQLDLNHTLYNEQRTHARFVNTGILATLGGAVVSDGLADGRVISGVGGQYNFVSMAHKLPTGRSILMIRAVRENEQGGKATSNIVFSYGHCTIPRHLRDIVVTEYGIADLRGKSDSVVAKALLEIADSRFQAELLKQAKEAGKIEPDYQIPAAFQSNTPANLAARLDSPEKEGFLPAFPLGCDFTEQEWMLAQALKDVKTLAATTPKWKLLLKALMAGSPPASAQPYLARMELTETHGLQAKVVRALLVEQLKIQGALG